MLAKEQLQGMWVSVPTEWDEQGHFDEKTFRDEIAMLIDAGAHGLYTTGSTGEFYALDWEEFQRVTDAFLAETAGRIPAQVGANWFNTRDTIRRVRHARDRGGRPMNRLRGPGVRHGTIGAPGADDPLRPIHATIRLKLPDVHAASAPSPLTNSPEDDR